MSYDDGSLGVRDDASADGEAGGAASNPLAALGASLRDVFERLKVHSEEWPRLYVNQQVGVYDGQVEVVGGPGGSPGAELEVLDDEEE